jgi:subtilisin family serine protease
MIAWPRRLLLTLRLGEMPEHIPAWAACARHGVEMPVHVDGGPIDRILRHFGGSARMARVHSARLTPLQRPDVAGARRFDDVEQLCGVARVLRVEVQQGERLPQLMRALAQLPGVECVGPERMIFGGLDAQPQPGTLEVDAAEAWRSREMIRLPQALAYAQGDRTVLVGLADTGVAGADACIERSMRPGFDTVDLSADAMPALQLVGDGHRPDQDPDDDVGHGTGCAGILCADSEHLPPGAAGLCQLVPARVLGAALRGQRRVGIGSVANIDAGVKRLVDLGVKIINMSFGTAASQVGDDDPLPHREVVRYAQARGVILVAASGNSGLTERYYPAALPGVIAVGAVDLDGAPARFATRGDHVALCAPGQGIWTRGLQGWQRATGTSFAAPFVTAVCALMVARAEARACPLPASAAMELLQATAHPFATAGVQGLGRGVLDAWAALRALDDWIDSNDEIVAREH